MGSEMCIRDSAEVEVEVPVILIGEAREVTQVSGMVDQTMFSLPVLSKPDSIPTELTADISSLEVGSTITVDDVELPEGVRAAVDGDETVATAVVTRSTIEAMRAEDEAEVAEGEEGAEGESEGDGGDDASDGDDS